MIVSPLNVLSSGPAPGGCALWLDCLHRQLRAVYQRILRTMAALSLPCRTCQEARGGFVDDCTFSWFRNETASRFAMCDYRLPMMRRVHKQSSGMIGTLSGFHYCWLGVSCDGARTGGERLFAWKAGEDELISPSLLDKERIPLETRSGITNKQAAEITLLYGYQFSTTIFHSSTL